MRGCFGEGFVLRSWFLARPLPLIVAAMALSACTKSGDLLDGLSVSSLKPTVTAYGRNDKECLARAMYFESNRSSREGMMAVGTVVMNRVKSDDFPDTVCGVVGQKKQFAPGVLTRSMNSAGRDLAVDTAEAVLKGERHPRVSKARFFHQAGLSFPYNNMHYVLEAGGNAFYEKRRGRRGRTVSVASVKQRKAPVVARATPVAATVATMTYETPQKQQDPVGSVFASGRWPEASD